ncbi:head-tail connector protein [Tabrizicola sp. M-4]|uniref:head-tail connector protein n=1 Tax=Tabrizicola sp. M-4 TaxID=3055847 RepID=UPI003DA91964
MLLRRVSAAAMPVPLTEIMDQLRQPQDAPTYIEGIRAAAHDVVSEMSGRCLGAETWEVMLAEGSGDIVLPKSPVQSITSISYFDAAGAVQTVPVEDYLLFAGQDRAKLRPAEGKNWPTLQRREDAMTIRFVAGYTVLPDGLKAAVRQASQSIYEGGDFPPSMHILINVHRLGWVAA